MSFLKQLQQQNKNKVSNEGFFDIFKSKKKVNPAELIPKLKNIVSKLPDKGSDEEVDISSFAKYLTTRVKGETKIIKDESDILKLFTETNNQLSRLSKLSNANSIIEKLIKKELNKELNKNPAEKIDYYILLKSLTPYFSKSKNNDGKESIGLKEWTIGGFSFELYIGSINNDHVYESDTIKVGKIDNPNKTINGCINIKPFKKTIIDLLNNCELAKNEIIKFEKNGDVAEFDISDDNPHMDKECLVGEYRSIGYGLDPIYHYINDVIFAINELVNWLAKSSNTDISNESFDEWGFGTKNGKNNSIVTDIDETDKVKEFEHYVLDEEKDDEANIYVSEVKDTSSTKEGDVVQHRGDSLKEFSNEGLFDFFKRSSNSIINDKMTYQEKIDTLTKAISALPDSSNNITGIKCNELAKYVQENNESKLKTLFSSFADFAKLQTNNDKVLSAVVSSVNKELSRKNITDIGDYKIDYFFKATSQLLPESNSNNWFGYTKNTLGNSLIEFYETDYDYGAPFASNLRPMNTEKSVNMVFDAIKDIKGFKQLLLTILRDSKVALDKYQKWSDARVIDKGYYEYSDEFVDVFNEYKSIIHYNFEEYLLDGLFAVSALYELLSKSTVTNSTESVIIPKQESLLDKLMKISYNKNVSLEDEENKQDDTDETETTENVSDEPNDETDSEDNQEEETDEGLSSGAEDSGDGSEETGGETNGSGEGEDTASEDEEESEEISEEREEEVELDQPDEEKVLIKNYLEPLLGEDVNKVKLFTAEEVNRPLYHVSMNANIKSFTPQVSKRVLSKENRSIPRISTSTSLVGCLNGYQSLVSDMDGREAKNFSGVFTVYNLPYQYAVKPDAKLLSDVEISDEYWLISWKKETFMTVPEVTATFTVPKIEKVYGNDGIDQTLHIYVKVRKGVLYIDHQRKLDIGCYHVKLEGYNFRYPLKNNNLIKINQISENDYNRVTSLSMMIKTR